MRAQSSIEALMLFASAALIVTLFMLYFGTQIASHAEEREFESLRDITDTIRQEVQLARQAGPGYARTIELPGRGGDKVLIFHLEYPPGAGGHTEMTVRFDPPIRDTIEASEVLGEGVFGTFSGGRNTIRTYPAGIIVTPDADVYKELLDANRVTRPFVDAAFAHLSGPVMLKDRIECAYAIANEWALDDPHMGLASSDYDLHVGWNVETDSSSECYARSYGYGERVFLEDHSGFPVSFPKGANLSCSIAFTREPGFAICPHSPDTVRVVESNTVRIINSPPQVAVEDWLVREGEDTISNTTTWYITFNISLSDADADDDSFNVSLVRDGTNALFLDCVSPCRYTAVDEGDEITFRTELEVPWPRDGRCEDVNRLSFRLRAIEYDAEPLASTLTPMTFGRLPCPGDGD